MPRRSRAKGRVALDQRMSGRLMCFVVCRSGLDLPQHLCVPRCDGGKVHPSEGREVRTTRAHEGCFCANTQRLAGPSNVDPWVHASGHRGLSALTAE